MNSAEYVGKLISDMKAQGVPLSEAAWKAALACVGWPYVFGARGQYCTPANRRARYSDDHPAIKTSCKNYNGSGSSGCSGCKWYPNDKLVRMYDCRGFTYWILLQVFGWELQGAGCTSQWNNSANWREKGSVADGIPRDVIVCLFYEDKNDKRVMAHTGLYYNGETCECSSGVQHSKSLNKKWTKWAVPACVGGVIPPPEPGTKPTLRRGDKGAYVTLAQTELKNKGYDLGKCGVDGDFGKATEAAVKQFQKDNGLAVDGVIGPKTWEKLDSSEPVQLYKVIVPHLTSSEADALMEKYPTAYKEKEG